MYYEFGAYELYFVEMKTVQRLTHDEQLACLEVMHQGRLEARQAFPNRSIIERGQVARAALVDEFLSLVVMLARRYVRYCKRLELLDLIQEGNVNLLLAIDRYELNGSEHERSSFVSYLMRYVRGAMVNAIWHSDRYVRVTEKNYGQLKQLRRVENALYNRLGREASVQEIAGEMGLDTTRVVELLEVRSLEVPTSMQGLVADDYDEGAYDFVSLYAHEAATETSRQAELATLVQEALQTVLSERQREVVRLSYGLRPEDGTCYSQSQVADMFHAMRESIGHSEREAKARLLEAVKCVVIGGQCSYTLRRTHHEDYYTAKEAMTLAGMSTTNFYRHVYNGDIPSVRDEGRKNVWRFPKAEFDAWYAKRSSRKVEGVS